ncbi:hypothetical protein MKW98_031507, partial [Papaver atlanticum]
CRNGKHRNFVEPEKQKKSKEAFLWVSYIVLDSSESWLACGSGRSLSIWIFPASKYISRIGTCSPTQDLVFDDYQVPLKDICVQSYMLISFGSKESICDN